MRQANKKLRHLVRNREICRRLKSGETVAFLASEYHVTVSRIRQIQQRESRWQTWGSES